MRRDRKVPASLSGLVRCASLRQRTLQGPSSSCNSACILPGFWHTGSSIREPGILNEKAKRLLIFYGTIFLVGCLQVVTGTTFPDSTLTADTLDGLSRIGLYIITGLAALAAFRRRSHIQMAAIWLAADRLFRGAIRFLRVLVRTAAIFAYEKIYYLDSATGTFINRNHFGIFLAICLPFSLELLQAGTIHERSRNWRERVVRFMEHGFIRRVLPAMAAVRHPHRHPALFLARSVRSRASGDPGLPAVRGEGAGIRRPVLALLILIPIILLTWQSVRAPGERFIEDPENTYSVGGRLPAWEAGLGMVPDHPVFGTGFGTFEHAFPAYQPPDLRGYWDHLHNDFLQFLVEGGLVSFGLVLLFVLLLFYPVPETCNQRAGHSPFQAPASWADWPPFPSQSGGLPVEDPGHRRYDGVSDRAAPGIRAADNGNETCHSVSRILLIDPGSSSLIFLNFLLRHHSSGFRSRAIRKRHTPCPGVRLLLPPDRSSCKVSPGNPPPRRFAPGGRSLPGMPLQPIRSSPAAQAISPMPSRIGALSG